LPEIFGPELKVGFAVRKGIPDSLRHQVQIFENYVLQRVNQKGLEVIVD
jgi:hypothetical protein